MVSIRDGIGARRVPRQSSRVLLIGAGSAAEAARGEGLAVPGGGRRLSERAVRYALNGGRMPHASGRQRVLLAVTEWRSRLGEPQQAEGH